METHDLVKMAGDNIRGENPKRDRGKMLMPRRFQGPETKCPTRALPPIVGMYIDSRDFGDGWWG